MSAPTSLGISVLALLAERPMHPYEMYRLLLDRHEDRRDGTIFGTYPSCQRRWRVGDRKGRPYSSGKTKGEGDNP